jgi:endonuclease/exonuclease/phosphatase family metal-dependent hydrolase
VDGAVNLARIVETARQMADFDVLCLQEVSDNFPGLKGSDGGNQFAELARLLPGHQAVEGVAVDRFDAHRARQRFGNMIFSRLPVVQVLRHQLPWPAEPTRPTMSRMALEVVLKTRTGPLRVTTTHLEFYSARQRAAQAVFLRTVQADACSHAGDVVQPHKFGSPFQTLPRNQRAILTGDFNCKPGDDVLGFLQEPDGDGSVPYRDAWPLAHPGVGHAATAGVHDDTPERCLDYVLVSADLASGLRRLEVDGGSTASDHQPLLLEIEL